MKVVVKNNANVPGKYVRYIKWRLSRLKSKFNEITNAEVFFKKIGNSTQLYNIHININAKNNQYFVSKADLDLDKIIKLIPKKLQYSLANKQ